MRASAPPNKENEAPTQTITGSASLGSAWGRVEACPPGDALQQLEQILLERKLLPTGTAVDSSKQPPILRRRYRSDGNAGAASGPGSSIATNRRAQRAFRNPLGETQCDQIAASWRQRIAKDQANGTAKTPPVRKMLFGPVQAPPPPTQQQQRQECAMSTPSGQASSPEPTPRSAGSTSYHQRVTANFPQCTSNKEHNALQSERQEAPYASREPFGHPPPATVLTDTSLLELENQIANLLESKCSAEEELSRLQLQCQRSQNENRQLRLQIARLEGALETKSEHWRTVRDELEETRRQYGALRQEHEHTQILLQNALQEKQRAQQEQESLEAQLKQVRHTTEAENAQREQLYERELCKLHTACARQERVIDELQRRWLRLNAMLQDLFASETDEEGASPHWSTPVRDTRPPYSRHDTGAERSPHRS